MIVSSRGTTDIFAFVIAPHSVYPLCSEATKMKTNQQSPTERSWSKQSTLGRLPMRETGL
jgi:hypothetical protein